jgi:hypothetical protein
MITKEPINWKGTPILVDAVRVKNKTFIISGKLLRTASLKKEWQEDVDDPDEVVRTLKTASARIDLLKFWQRIPESTAKYPYYKEWRDIATIPVKTFEHWWEKQINSKTRNMVRKTRKMGVLVEQIEFDDEFVRGVMGIFNESPVKRGKPFWHYGKNFETVKREMAGDLGKAIFIGAHYEKELVGFIKLIVTDRYAMVTLILDKQSHREKAPMNGMIAKAVEICAKRNVPYITYTVWRRGDHGQFQKRNGFEKIPVPEYYVPLTIKGKLALRLGLHKGLKGALPEKVMGWLLGLRAKWYSVRYARRIQPRGSEGRSVTQPSV